MKRSFIRVSAVFAAAIMLLCCFASLAEKSTEVLFEGFDSASGALPSGWYYHSYQNEYMGNATSHAEVAELEGEAERGGVLHISVTVDDDAAVYRTVPVQPNSVYRMSCLVMTKGVIADSPDNQGDPSGANIALREIICRSAGVFGDSDWQRAELVGVTGPDQTTLTVSCRVGGYSYVARGEAWFDDFRLEKLDDYSGDTVNFFSEAAPAADDAEEGGGRGLIIALIVLAAIVLALLVVLLIGKRNNGGGKSAGAEGSRANAASEGEGGQKQEQLERIKGRSIFDLRCEKLPAPTDNKLHFVKLDYIFVTVLTLVYALIALFRLGSTDFPENAWTGDTGDSVRITFDSPTVLKKIWQNSGISYCNYKLTTDTGKEYTLGDDANSYWSMYRWKNLTGEFGNEPVSSVTLTVLGGDTGSGRAKDPDLILNELAFFDSAGELIPCSAQPGAEALVDEQETVPDHPNYMTGMYFDEVYHARTALEHIKNLNVYEWTHPPLGKLMIAVGILLFGMNPFGWRIVGTVLGIIMVPLMYCFAKRIVKRPKLCLLSASLFAFDFMHFAQTRIATVDVFALFFTMLMTYYMYQFITCDIGDSFGRMIKPLALSGLFFGLGCASKWTCIYTGAALAVLFFGKLVWLGLRSRSLAKNDPEHERAPHKFFMRAVRLCLSCILFFIIIPAAIYAASYFRYYTAQWKPAEQQSIVYSDPSRGETAEDVKLTFSEAANTYVKGVIQNQKDMYGYHSGLDSEHKASSPWWMWIFNLRPTWFYVSYAPDGTVGTISTFGNPAVWNICFIGTVALVLTLIFHRRRLTRKACFLFICMASSLLPWVFVTRSTYAYHYFSTVPFIILASVYLLKYIEDINEYSINVEGRPVTFIRKLIPSIKYIWLGLALALFALFYPVISGLEVSKTYITLLEWVPFHKFEITGADGTVKRTLRIGWTFLGYGD